MFYFVAMAALAAGSLFAVAVLFGWLTFEAVQDWSAAA